MVIQLLECCSEDLRWDLTRKAGGSLFNKEEKDVLKAIKALAVRQESSMVARLKLHNMKQVRDEPIRSFSAKVIGQAATCKYVTECPQCSHKVDYWKSIARDVPTRGIADQEIQRDILGDQNQDRTFEEILALVEAKESGRDSVEKLVQSEGASAACSTYTREKHQVAAACFYCGNKGHGKNPPPQTRRKECPAYGHRRKNCQKENHFERVCRSKEKIKPKPRESAGTDEGMGAMFNGLCSINQPISLGHHLYHHLNDRWTQRSSLPHPYIKVKIEALPQDYKDLGLELKMKEAGFQNKDW